jgi:hypothetical protein
MGTVVELVVEDVVVLMLGLFVNPPPPAFSELPGPVVVVVVEVVAGTTVDDVVVVSKQLGLLGTWAQLGSATAETAETAIAAANIAATVRSTSIRFTLIHPPFLYSFFPTNLDAGAGRLVSALPLATNKRPAPCRTRVLR